MRCTHMMAMTEEAQEELDSNDCPCHAEWCMWHDSEGKICNCKTNSQEEG